MNEIALTSSKSDINVQNTFQLHLSTHFKSLFSCATADSMAAGTLIHRCNLKLWDLFAPIRLLHTDHKEEVLDVI
jgi:hypothetical protein